MSNSSQTNVRSQIIQLRWLLPPLLSGMVLRLYSLGQQVVSGDELHAVRAAVSIDFPSILYTYLLTDHCIPLSSFYRLATLVGITLNETLLRFPVVLSSILTLILIPLWTEKALGRRTALCLAWWIALSPTLIFYSRIVRSYMPIVLLGFAAVALFVSWTRHGKRRDAVGYVLVGALAIYFHPAAGPFVGAPLVWLVLAQLLRVRDLPSFRSTVGVSLGLVAAVAAFLIPASRSLSELVQMKRVESHLTLDTWRGVFMLEAGSSNRWFVYGFWTLAIIGLIALVRRYPRLGTLGIVLVAVQIAGLIVLSPLAMENPGIFNRYLLICLPMVLICVAHGFDLAVLQRLDKDSRGGRVAISVLAASLPTLFFLTGPLLEDRFHRGSFLHRAQFTTFHKPPKVRPKLEMPDAYEWLSTQREGILLEFPWHPFWRYMNAYPRYQQQHGRQVVVGIGDRTMWHPTIELRNTITPSLDRLLDSPASWLIIHLGISEEEARNDAGKKRAGTPATKDDERRARMLGRMERVARDLDHTLQETWGEPDHRTDDCVIWDLDRVRLLPRSENPADNEVGRKPRRPQKPGKKNNQPPPDPGSDARGSSS